MDTKGIFREPGLFHGRKSLALFIFFVVLSSAWTQGNRRALIAFADDETALTVIDPSGLSRSTSIGDEVKIGDTLKTGLTTVELRLDPNGSIIKVGPQTSFAVEALADTDSSSSNDFYLAEGKIRTVAAKTLGTNGYRIRTPTSVCGVRGTDFSMTVIAGTKDAVYVQRGVVDFSKTQSDGTLKTLTVQAGQYADAFGATFAPLPFTADQWAAEFSSLEFKFLDPQGVPQGTETPGSSKQEEKAQTNAETASSSPSKGMGVSENKSKFMAWLGDMVGFEIGSVVIDGNTYSKAIIQPVFHVGKATLGLYLPIIYTSNLFDAGTWYRPGGNNEWSFGGEYWASDPIKASQDALRDLALKIRFIEYGDPLVDPFYLKAGNLSDMSLGHGILMRNFANDSDFPAVRRVGVNTGFDGGSWGVEGVVNDLAQPDIFGGRIKFLSIFGLTGVVDLHVAGDLATQAQRDALGDPLLLGGAFDIDIPVLKAQSLALRAYADLGAVVPYTRTDIPSGPSAGFQYKTVYDPDRSSGLDGLRNYGFISGFMGRLLVMDWRLEYRRYQGIFHPSFFDAAYERNRARYAQQFADLLIHPDTASYPGTNGIYGEAGFSFFRDQIQFTGGYLMPWSTDTSFNWVDVTKNDYILARLGLKKGLIPVYDLSLSLSYERTGFVYALVSGTNVFDAYAVFRSEVVLPIGSTVDFAVMTTTTAAHDGNGNIIYEGTGINLQPKVETSITFETRIRF